MRKVLDTPDKLSRQMQPVFPIYRHLSAAKNPRLQIFALLKKLNDMATNIIFLITLLAYSILVSQPFMYMLALKYAQSSLDIGPYMELRKLIDASMRKNFKYVIYTALLANLLLVVLTAGNPGSLLFLAATLSLITLIADVFITLKGNMPINDVINTWTPERYPADWTDYRERWFRFLGYRGVLSMIGFTGLLVAAVFGMPAGM